MRRLICLLISLLATPSFAVEEGSKLARTAWAAWKCQVYATYEGDEIKANRLFELGLKAARALVEKHQAGQVKSDDIILNSHATLWFTMDGTTPNPNPSPEFAVGRIYQTVADTVFDEIVTHDDAGRPLPAEKYRLGAAMKDVAVTKFRNANCDLIN
ncbi:MULTISPECIES: hypothetical protein [Sinorhizobium]|uniref:hypothetical protein n=1 Tax=Sinorhizobium TaxID=28105 RepID=UPI000BE8923B|nr:MULTISPECIES: hypothetical protein [Sinorhizobium]PDT50046.1 hypothetical protein CO664_26380 [Sinorhizobium sp. NG07B]POH33693.1 hypothetical protein ATY30_01535 [Sinorhizobium americanum]